MNGGNRSGGHEQRRLPRSALAMRDADVMVVVLHLWVTDGRAVHDTIVVKTGLSRRTVNEALHDLRDAGLVAFDDGRWGTIRPTCAVVIPARR